MISVVSIHFNDPILLLNSIRSVAEQSGVETEVILIDNSSNFPVDELKDLHVEYRYIDPGYNSGFARGVNAGLEAANGEYILLLNQDAQLPDPGTLKKCLATLSSLPPKTILGINLVDSEGKYQRSIWTDDPGLAKEWHTSPFYIRLTRHRQPEKIFYEQLEQMHRKSGFVHRINGAFLLFHRSLVDEDGLYWDKDFFLYGEDVEWAYRCHKKGGRFYHLAEVLAVHEGSSASAGNITAKQQQVIVSDWLAVRKMKGRCYIAGLLLLTAINRILDILLFHLATMKRNKPGKESIAFALMQLQLIIKFGWLLVLSSTFSSARDFRINCYRN